MLHPKFDHSFIFERNVLDYLAFNTNSNKVFVYIVNISHYKKDINLLWECLSPEEKIRAKQYRTRNLHNKYRHRQVNKRRV
jgi:hypothetical protein